MNHTIGLVIIVILDIILVIGMCLPLIEEKFPNLFHKNRI